MKRIATLITGTALAAALSFGAQATNPPANTDTTKPAVKKHVKKHKTAKKAGDTTNAAPAASTPAPAAKK